MTMPEPCTAAAPPPGGAGGRLAGGWWAVGGGTSAARRLPASARAVGRCARLGVHAVAGIGGAWAWAAWAGRVAAGGRLVGGWRAVGGRLGAARVRRDGCRPVRGQWGGARGLVHTRWPVLVVRGRGPRGRGGWRLAGGWRAVGGWLAGGTSAVRRLPAGARAVGRCARLGVYAVAGIGGAWARAAWEGRVAAGRPVYGDFKTLNTR